MKLGTLTVVVRIHFEFKQKFDGDMARKHEPKSEPGSQKASLVSSSLVGKVLTHAFNTIAEEEDPYLKMQGVYNNPYPRKMKAVSPKPPRDAKLADKTRRSNTASPRHSKNLRGEVVPSTYLHVPRKSPSQLRRRKFQRKLNAAVVETSILTTAHMSPIVSEKQEKQVPDQGEVDAVEQITGASSTGQKVETKNSSGQTAGDNLRFRGFLRGLTAIKRKAKAIQSKSIHAKPVLLLTGTGHLSLSPENNRTGKWNIKNQLTVDMWLFIPRTETLFAETSANVRKHTGIETDEDGNFVKWLCCGRKDADIFGWCPAWQGDMTKSVVQTADGARSSDFIAAKQRKLKMKKKKAQIKVKGRENNKQTVISSDQRMKEGIFASHRTNPTTLVSQKGRFKIHDTGGYCVDDQKMYGFSVIASDGTETCLTNFSIPVDRWVIFSAVYDGFYLYTYVDGQEVAAVRRHVDTVQGQLQHSDAPVIIGGDFTGMISHMRIWNIARTNEQINASISHRVSVKEVHSCGLPGHVSSSANASEVFVPNELSGKTATYLLANIPFYDVNLYHGDHISDQSIFGHNAHICCDHFSWRINPPMFFGAPRPYKNFHQRAFDPSVGHQYSTISHNKIACTWKWRPLSSLAEHLREWGKIRILVRWDKGTKFKSSPLDFVYKLLYKLSKQDFPQDWILDVRRSAQGALEGDHVLRCKSDTQDNLFFLAMVHMDHDNNYHERILYTSKSSDFDFPDCVSIMAKMEAQIRIFTTFWHSEIFQVVKAQLRAKLAATKEQIVDSHRSLKSMIESRLDQNNLRTALETMQSGLPSAVGNSNLDNGVSEKLLTQSLFNQVIWILGVNMELPELSRLAVIFENEHADKRLQLNV